ncbi:MAG: ribonuclease P protein component [Pseudomonadales bacterium]|nr:ribonuclease P protein component [Pseudomonadales bacterium]
MPTAPNVFPRAHRLLVKAEFDAVFASPDLRQRGAGVFLLIRLRRQLGPSRLGFVLAKRHLKRAVDRNRIRRACREAFRQHRFLRPVDVIVLAQGNAKAHLNDPLTGKFTALFQRLDSKLGSVASVKG